MKYYWGEKEFVIQIKKLNYIIEHETNIRRKAYLQKVADNIDALYHSSFNKFKSPNITAKQRLSNILDSRLKQSRYYSIINVFFDNIQLFLDRIDIISDIISSNYGDVDYLTSLTGTTITEEESISMTYEFYKAFDKELFSFFEIVYDDRFDTLRFISNDEEKKKSFGNTIFLDGVKKNFISVVSIGGLSKYFSLVHEYGHAISNLINSERVYANNDDFFLEVAALFPECVAMYELYKNVGNIDAAYEQYTNLITFINYANFLTLHSPILNLWSENNYVMSKKFFKELEELYNIDEEVFGSALEATLEEEGVYVLSYIVAIELLNIYKKDKNKALELYKNFIRIPANEDTLPFILEIFEVNKNVKKETEEIVSNMELILKK